MTFNSLTFAVFFVLLLGAYWIMRSWSARKNLLLVASYAFYAAWNPPFVLLLILSTVVDWIVARKLDAENGSARRKAWLVLSLVTNLGLLGFFKYGGFMMENFQWLLAQMGVQYQPPAFNIILPVGISFYTFQTLSYTIDVYRRDLKANASLRDFAFFVTFFPQLVAGPIVRAIDFLPQCATAPKPDGQRLGWGLFLMTVGMFQKIVLADALLASASETVFSFRGPLASIDAWAGVMAFSGQIFFDFAGYSTCAIGAALCFGFSLCDNFHAPYAAVGFSDFWRRWHMSLSTWLRDYLYIPLGGNRNSAVRTIINLLVVMFIGGLWHGAAWTFVAWGVIHGTFLAIEHVLRRVFKNSTAFSGPLWSLAFALFTYVAVCFSWVFFRAPNFKAAIGIIMAMVGVLKNGAMVLPTLQLLQVAIVIALLLVAHWFLRRTTLERVVSKSPAWLVAGSWAAMAFTIILTQGNGNAFIYFQF